MKIKSIDEIIEKIKEELKEESLKIIFWLITPLSIFYFLNPLIGLTSALALVFGWELNKKQKEKLYEQLEKDDSKKSLKSKILSYFKKNLINVATYGFIPIGLSLIDPIFSILYAVSLATYQIASNIAEIKLLYDIQKQQQKEDNEREVLLLEAIKEQNTPEVIEKKIHRLKAIQAKIKQNIIQLELLREEIIREKTNREYTIKQIENLQQIISKLEIDFISEAKTSQNHQKQFTLATDTTEKALLSELEKLQQVCIAQDVLSNLDADLELAQAIAQASTGELEAMALTASISQPIERDEDTAEIISISEKNDKDDFFS